MLPGTHPYQGVAWGDFRYCCPTCNDGILVHRDPIQPSLRQVVKVPCQFSSTLYYLHVRGESLVSCSRTQKKWNSAEVRRSQSTKYQFTWSLGENTKVDRCQYLNNCVPLTQNSQLITNNGWCRVRGEVSAQWLRYWHWSTKSIH